MGFCSEMLVFFLPNDEEFLELNDVLINASKPKRLFAEIEKGPILLCHTN